MSMLSFFVDQILSRGRNTNRRHLAKRRHSGRASRLVEALESKTLLTAIGNGQELLATMNAGESRSFELTAAIGDTVRFSVGETDAVNNFLATPRLQVFRPDGTSVDVDTGTDNAEVQFSANVSGTYTAVVRDSLDDDAMGFRIRALVVPGSSAPSLITNRDAVLTSGQELESSIPLGSFAVYRLDASVGQTVRFSVGETNAVNNFQATPFLQIIGPDGSSVGTSSNTDNAALQFAATTTGTYTAIVRDSQNDNAMGFRVRTLVIPGTAAPNLITDRDAVLTSGQELEASIPLGSFAVYQLDAAIGDLVRFSVGETDAVNNFLATPRLEVFRPDGTSVDIDTGTDNAELQFSANISGTYTAVVRDSQNDDAMGFRIRALVVPGSSAPSLIANRDAVLTSGQELEANIPLGSFAVYRLDASVGQTVRVSVGETNAVNNFQATPFLQIIGPDGSSVGTSSNTDNAALQFAAATTGTYTAIVRDSQNDNAMGYRVRALVIPGSSTPNLITDRDAVLTSGQELEASIPLGSFAVYQLDAAIGEMVRFSVGETDAVNNFLATPRLEVFRPDGTSVEIDSGTDNAELQFSANISGTYTAVVRDSQNDDAMGFRIRALVVPGSSPPSLIANRDAVLTSGQELEANIPLGSFAVYRLDASVGQTVRVSVGETNAVNNFQATPFLQIIAPDGSSVGTNSNSDNAALQFSASSTGTYTAIVRDSQSDTEMGFRIRAVVVPGSSAPDFIAGRDAILTSGQELEASIPLGTFAVYRLDARIGETVRFSVGETDAVNNFLATPRLEVFGPDGTSVGIDSGTVNAELQFAANSTGTYTAIVRDSLNDDAMGFRIRALVIPGSAAPGLIAGRDSQLIDGQEVATSIPLGTFAVYQFSASTGAAVRLTVTETNAVNNFQATPFLQVLDPSGASVGTDSGTADAELQFSAATSGTFTAIVRDSQSDDAMGFRIAATIEGGTASDTTPPVVDLNGAATGVNFSTTYDFLAGGAQSIASSELTVTETKSQVQSAEVVMTEGLQTGDLLTIDTVTGISSQFANGTLTLTGTIDSAAYQTALRSLKLTATSGTTVTRQVAVRVTDAAGNISLTRTISVTPVATDNNAVLDVDGSGGEAAAQSDGLLIFAVLAGVSSESQLTGLMAAGSPRSVAQVIQRVQELRDSLQLDVDDDGTVNAQSDGLLIFAILAGVTDASQLNNLMGDNAQRSVAQTVAEVEALRSPPTSTATGTAEMASVMAAVFVAAPGDTAAEFDRSLPQTVVVDVAYADAISVGDASSSSTKLASRTRRSLRTTDWSELMPIESTARDTEQEFSLLDDIFQDLQHEEELLN